MRAVIRSMRGVRCGCFGVLDFMSTASVCSTVAIACKPAARIVGDQNGCVGAAVLAALLALPAFAIDSLAYGKLSLVPLNTILYNLFSRTRGAGPELYGTEPPTFYLNNLVRNFNVFAPLALLSLPLLLVTARVDPKRFRRPAEDTSSKKGTVAVEQPSSLFSLALLRIAPFYVWLLLLSLQAISSIKHK